MSTPLPAGLTALATRLSIDAGAWRRTGRLDLQVDAHRRVTLRRGARDAIEVEARLARLPLVISEREAMLDRVMLRVTAGAGHRVGVPVMGADGRQLLLQARLREDRPHGVEEDFETFLNDLDYWTQIVGERS